ncbi:hypothetical protein RB653_003662 [Dictyostelium firmibasis]|uniref:Uncharacterized protein n=1 Tax=Dictyostelium firmibasis TaxID=79012 RepID=A0AAN7YRT5_9MYCE
MTITRSISSLNGMNNLQNSNQQMGVSEVINTTNTNRNVSQSKNGVTDVPTKYGDVTDASEPCSIL